MGKYNYNDFFSTEARKAFVEREAKLRSWSHWPLTKWYNDENFCELWRVAVTEIDQLKNNKSRLISGLKQIILNGHQPSDVLVDIAKRILDEFEC